jgi:hypothetical protein
MILLAIVFSYSILLCIFCLIVLWASSSIPFVIARCVRLGRYLEVVHALRSASLESSGAPLPPSLLLHLPLLLASE